MRYFPLFFLLFLFPIANAQWTEKELSYLIDSLEQNDLMWGHVELNKKGKEIYSRSFGYHDYDSKAKISSKSLFKVGSITKIFTSVLILQMVDEGKLSLNTKLSEFFPEIKNAKIVTIENLLSHKSGIPNYTAKDDFMEQVSEPISQEQLIKDISEYKADFSPGIKYEYSNSNYFILGAILEKLSKKNFADLLQERIIDKLGLKNTFYLGAADSSRLAESYAIVDEDILPTEIKWNMDWGNSTGGLISNCTDLSTFMSALFDKKILSKNMLKSMTEPLHGKYLLGLQSFSFYDKKFYGHSGRIENYSSYIMFNNKADLFYCSTVNLDNNNSFNHGELMISTLSHLYNKTYSIPDSKESKGVDVPLNILESYKGFFSPESSSYTNIHLFIKNNQLFAYMPGYSSFPLTAISNTTFDNKEYKLEIEFLNETPLKFKLKHRGNRRIYIRFASK